MKQHFIDAGAFVAQSIPTDQYHDQAVAIAKTLKEEKSFGITTDFVLSEVFTFLRRKVGYPAGIKFYEAIKASEDITIIYTGQKTFEQSIATLARYHDKEFSFVDCVSFTVMEERHLTYAFTFDKHFSQAGFELVRKI